MCIYIYIYIYIYIHLHIVTLAADHIDVFVLPLFSVDPVENTEALDMYICMCVYINIYT